MKLKGEGGIGERYQQFGTEDGGQSKYRKYRQYRQDRQYRQYCTKDKWQGVVSWYSKMIDDPGGGGGMVVGSRKNLVPRLSPLKYSSMASGDWRYSVRRWYSPSVYMCYRPGCSSHVSYLSAGVQ